MKSKEKAFLITIDTEGDYIWNRKTWSKNSINNRITVKNGKYLYRFQQLCEKYSFKPTYLVDNEMCDSKEFVEMGKDGLKRGKLEIGMHMHAWTALPYYSLERGKKSGGNHPYIGEYPSDIIDKKVKNLTDKLTDTFGVKPQSHRSGRWYIDRRYIKILKKYGYRSDCSVTPGIDWRGNVGLTDGSHGIDYRFFPTYAYEMSEKHIEKSGRSGFVEVPLSTMKNDCGKIVQLRPYRHNINELLMLVEEKKSSEEDYLEFMLHSSEMMRAGSPNFLTELDIEILYEDMDRLFSTIAGDYKGYTMTDYVMEKFG